jgi:hypothetical protein
MKKLLLILLLWAASAEATQLGNTDVATTARSLDDSWVWGFGLFIVPAGGGDIDSVVFYANEGGTSYVKSVVCKYSGGVATIIDSTASVEVASGGAWFQLAAYIGATMVAGDTVIVALRGDSDVAIQSFADAGSTDADSAFYLAGSVPYANAWSSPISSWDAKEYYHGSVYIVYTAGGAATTSQLTVKGTMIVKGTLQCGD